MALILRVNMTKISRIFSADNHCIFPSHHILKLIDVKSSHSPIVSSKFMIVCYPRSQIQKVDGLDDGISPVAFSVKVTRCIHHRTWVTDLWTDNTRLFIMSLALN